MNNHITQQQLESYLWGAAVLLRGTIDAGDYKQFIFPLLFYKRLCDVFDEETRAALAESGGDPEFAAYPENHRFQIPPDAHWCAVRQAATNVGRTIQSAMRAIETANPDKLYGIFGDARWTNKDRLSDAMLRDLIEHFSTLDLTVANLPEDELGQGYEYLIKKFADDSGHTAAEFYTNRTVVHLMTELLQPRSGESIYDPTCGSGGMLLSCIAHLRRCGQEWRNVHLYGQERNLMTSAIARMNCFLHGIEEFQIVRGDTLSEPKFVQGDRLMRFDVVLANPPYSIKQWDRDAFAADPWGRNRYGTPPQGRADYAFWQHILCSLAPETGRCAILFPHGVLFRQEEAEMRRKLIEADLIECVIGLGPNLFYNSAMEACVMVCRGTKTAARRSRILLIRAADEVARERSNSLLTAEHIERIVAGYNAFKTEAGFSRVVTPDEVQAHNSNLSIALYVETERLVSTVSCATDENLASYLLAWLATAAVVRASVLRLTTDLDEVPALPDPSSARLCAPDWLDRKTWRRVTLGDVGVRGAGKFAPREDSVHRWVGADHIDEGDIHVRRWSDTTDPLFPPTFRFTFRAGHVLLHSRNPKKVVMPDFDGVTGEKIFVLQPRDEGILRADYLAFVLMSGCFRNWAVKWLSGSVNKFLNWTAFERFQFGLPPLDEQRRIAGILWAVCETLGRSRGMLARLEELRTATLLELYRKGIEHKDFVETALGPRPRAWEVAPLGRHYEVQLGKMMSPKALSGTSQRP